MINKIYQTIHNRFPRLFKFVFSIRYLFAVFFVAILLFFLIPHLFDYKNKVNVIDDYLFKAYGLKVNEIQTIEYQPFPFPRLNLINFKGNFLSKDVDVKIENLILYPSLKSIYSFNNYQVKKIILNKSEIVIETNQIKKLIEQFISFKKKLFIKNLVLKVQHKKINLLDLENINFKNYGLKKRKVDGEIFNREFKIKFSKDYKNINFKLLNTGISGELNFDEELENLIKTGSFQSKILASSLKLNFIYNGKSIEFDNLFFRNKKLSFDSKGNFKIKPFFKITLNSNIKNIRPEIFSNLDLLKLLAMKDLIKKINGDINFYYQSNKFSNNLINRISLKNKLEIGRLSFSKVLSVTNSNTICTGKANLLEEFPILDFDCSLKSPDKKKFLKRFNIDYPKKNEPLNLTLKGKLSISKNKVNFEYIKLNEYEASTEDLKYYKNIFEDTFLKKNFLENFNINNIKKFILEIS